MHRTNRGSIRLYDGALHIKLDQFATLFTVCWLKRWRIRPITLKIVPVGPITNIAFEDLQMVFALRTIAPVISCLVLKGFMQTTKCVFMVIARTYIEQIPVFICANGAIATFRSRDGALFSAQTTVGT